MTTSDSTVPPAATALSGTISNQYDSQTRDGSQLFNRVNLKLRQIAYLMAYTDSSSSSFGNSYKSALSAGYSPNTARNFNHLKPYWLSENIGQIAAAISPEQIMSTLTSIIHDDGEPTIIKLKAIEMTMKAYNMLSQRHEHANTVVTLNVDYNLNITLLALAGGSSKSPKQSA